MIFSNNSANPKYLIMKAKIVLCLCFVFFGCIALFAQNDADSFQEMIIKEGKRIDSIKQSAIGKEFYSFEAMTLNMDSISINDLAGKVTMINLWFEGCAPCIAEFGEIFKLYNKLKDYPDFQLLSFTTDPPEVAKKAVEKYNINYPVCPISRKYSDNLNFGMGFPTNIILNKEKKIIFFKSGGPIEQVAVEKEIKKIEDTIMQLLNNN